MDLPSHLNAKHYAICDAVFHILLSLSSLSLLSFFTLLPVFSRDATNYEYCRTIRGSAELISIPSSVPWDTDCEECADFECLQTWTHAQTDSFSLTLPYKDDTGTQSITHLCVTVRSNTHRLKVTSISGRFVWGGENPPVRRYNSGHFTNIKTRDPHAWTAVALQSVDPFWCNPDKDFSLIAWKSCHSSAAGGKTRSCFTSFPLKHVFI